MWLTNVSIANWNFNQDWQITHKVKMFPGEQGCVSRPCNIYKEKVCILRQKCIGSLWKDDLIHSVFDKYLCMK